MSLSPRTAESDSPYDGHTRARREAERQQEVVKEQVAAAAQLRAANWEMGCPADAQEHAVIPPELQNPESTLSIRTDSQQKDKDVYRLRGHVEVTYQGMKLTADEAELNAATGDVVARGHVVFIDPQAHLEAAEVHYNMRTRKGWFRQASGSVRANERPRPRVLTTENPFYLRAEKVERLDPDTYRIEKARVSSCQNEARGWSFATRSARIKAGDSIVGRDDVFRLLGVPVFYAPVFVSSIARDPRKTGFLLPYVGNSSQKGYIIGDGVFWAINPSTDIMFGLENYSQRGLARVGRFRATPSEASDFSLDYFGINDRGVGPNHESKASGNSVRAVGETPDVGDGFRGVVDVDYVSSLAMRLTFTDNFTQAVTSEAHQTGFLTKNFDAYSLSFYTTRYQDFLSAVPGQNQSVSIWQAPSVSFSGMDKQAGQSPFYFSFDASAAGVGRSEPGFSTPALSERLDFHPEVTLRSKPFLGFYLTPSLGVRATRYGTSLEGNGESLNRLLAELSVDLRPPSFERVLEKRYWGRKFKHVIEPDIRYDLVRARKPETIDDVVRFDEIDILSATNEIEYSLTNTILERKDSGDGPDQPQAREVLSLRLSQKYYFDPTFGGALVSGQNVVFEPTISLTGFAFAQGRHLSPIVSVLKIAPSSDYDTELRADFSPSGGGVLNMGVTSHVKHGPVGLAFTDFFINRTASLLTQALPIGPLSQLQSFNLFRLAATYGDVNRKGFSGAFGLDYNLAQGLANQVVSQARYNFGCFGLDFEYRRFALGTLRQENSWRVALSLANVGTFGNLKPRETLY